MITSKVMEIGESVPEFKEEMLVILFGTSATPELKPISVIHEFNDTPDNVLQVGAKIQLGDQTYTINQVGSSANQNFEELGHVSIYFRSAQEEVLPGAVIASPKVFPTINVGDELKIWNE